MKLGMTAIAAMFLTASASIANATPFTSTSPTGLDVTTVGASTVGGVVVDMLGLNNAHVVSQTAASSLFIGYANTGTPSSNQGNPFTIGVQEGFTAAITNQLGGGLQSISVRFTLEDGDSAAGNFDDGFDLVLQLNGINAGYWSDVQAENTDGLGNQTANGYSGGGFRNNLLDTGWFTVSDAATLASIFSSINANETLVFGVRDVDPYDNYYDFTQGIDASLINVGQGPGLIPSEPNPNDVPEPGTLALLGLGVAIAATRRRRA